MNDRYLYKAKRKDNGEWVEGIPIKTHIGLFICFEENPHYCSQYGYMEIDEIIIVDENTLCQCTGLRDKNGKLIWENDILMCNGNPKDIVKAIYGEFNVINVETLSVTDRVIGWHYEVVQTDRISKYEPFCLSMPLTEEYVKLCEMEVVDNPELLEVEE